MINNRQQNGRRRGRGGGPRSPTSAPGIGNRQDNRSRGNAAQLHEKYKAMARDAQLAGDRVQTEYYHQFADHYFRVLSEGRARFEEQRPRRDDDEDEEQDEQFQGSGDYEEQAERPQRQDRYERQPRPDRQDRPERQDRQMREDRPQRDDRPQGDNRPERAAREDRPQRDDRPQREDRSQREDRPQREDRQLRDSESESGPSSDDQQPARIGRNGGELRPRRPRVRREAEPASDGNGGGERIAMDVLPPAISAVDSGDAPAPRRRTRRPRPENDTDIAPAA